MARHASIADVNVVAETLSVASGQLVLSSDSDASPLYVRIILIDGHAPAIFKCEPSSISNDRYKSEVLAIMYSVSAKSIRDSRVCCHIGHTCSELAFSCP